MIKEFLKIWEELFLKRTGGRGEFFRFMLQEPVGENDIVVDMHSHTFEGSDGIRRIQKYISEAIQKGIAVFSLTDHDSIQAYIEIKNGNVDISKYKGKIIPGVEITTQVGDNIVETLLYGFDVDVITSPEIVKMFPYLDPEFKRHRIINLAHERVKIINELGICDRQISLNDLISLEIENEKGAVEEVPLSKLGLDAGKDLNISAYSQDPVPRTFNYNGKECKINISFLNKKFYNLIDSNEKGKSFLQGYELKGKSYPINDWSTFNRVVIQRSDSPIYVDESKYRPTMEEVNNLTQTLSKIQKENYEKGLSKENMLPIWGLAHPYGYGALDMTPEKLMEIAIENGADLLECMHGFCEPDQAETIFKICHKHGLLPTMGGDHHGFYSNQGDKTELGIMPSQGILSKEEDNPCQGAWFSLYNLFYICLGLWRKNGKDKLLQHLQEELEMEK